MTLPRRPPSFTAFHHNLLLQLALFHPTLTVRAIKDLRYTSGELVFYERDLRKYCGRLLTRLKEKSRDVLQPQLDTSINPFKDIKRHRLLPCPCTPSSSPPPNTNPPRSPQSPSQHQHYKSSTTTMAKTPSKHRKSRSASRSTTPPPRAHGSARKSPYPTKKSSFPTIQDALGSLGLDDALIKYHTWPFSKQGVDSESGLMVCSGHVNDSETNPKESFFSTRAIIPIKNKTMLVEHSQRYICSGFCTDKNGDPALWIQQPGTLETPLANGMADLNALSMFANLMFGGDNKALNEEMKKTYIEASEFGDLEKATIDVITLPTLSANEYDDEEEEEDEGNTGTKKWFYSNAKYNNYPDKSNNLIVRPPVHELKPVVYYPQGGQSVQNLKGNMTVANGYVMVQVYVEGSRRNLTMPKATKDEVDYDAYMEKVAKQVQDSLKVSQAQGQGNN